jgi:hypothetical protein
MPSLGTPSASLSSRPESGRAILKSGRAAGTVFAVRYLIELPGGDGGAVVREFVEDWIEAPALRRIVELEGGTWPSGSLEERVEALHEFSDRWDFRGGAERLDIETAEGEFESEQILAAASELGLTVADPPSQPHYNHALVLGGTALASIYRLRHLYELREKGTEVDHVAVLTALREVSEAELELARERPEVAEIARGPETEFEVMTAATAAFSHEVAEIERTPNENPHLASAAAHVGDAVVLAAPSADPDRRANTRDNYDVYARQIEPGASVLVVTSSIYLPYQFFIALQALGWEQPRTIEAVGFPPEWMGGILTGPKNVLQEIRSALFGAMMTLRQLASAEEG